MPPGRTQIYYESLTGGCREPAFSLILALPDLNLPFCLRLQRNFTAPIQTLTKAGLLAQGTWIAPLGAVCMRSLLRRLQVC